MQPPSVTPTGVYVHALAKEFGVVYQRTPTDELADVITRLSGDTVDIDATENLIVALRRAGIIDGPTMVSLLGKHLDERFGSS